MAEQTVGVQRESFSCSVCLELLKEVVTIPCGHSYCRRCISSFWDGEQKEKKAFSCPQCRQTFTPRPVLMVNPLLAELVEKLKESSLQEEAAVSQLRDRLHDVLKEKTGTVDKVELLQLQEPTSRAGFLKYSQEITLDPNTAHTRLRLSKINRKVTGTGKDQLHPDHPDRFTEWYQVLSRESLTGRSYWEVEVKVCGMGSVYLGVVYKSISRAGRDKNSEFGFNDKSWMLECHRNGYRFHHDDVKTPVSDDQSSDQSSDWSSRIGVFVDQPAGILSFYRVTDTMTLLHRVHASFTEPLLMGVRMSYVVFFGGGIAEICDP